MKSTTLEFCYSFDFDCFKAMQMSKSKTQSLDWGMCFWARHVQYIQKFDIFKLPIIPLQGCSFPNCWSRWTNTLGTGVTWKLWIYIAIHWILCSFRFVTNINRHISCAGIAKGVFFHHPILANHNRYNREAPPLQAISFPEPVCFWWALTKCSVWNREVCFEVIAKRIVASWKGNIVQPHIWAQDFACFLGKSV